MIEMLKCWFSEILEMIQPQNIRINNVNIQHVTLHFLKMWNMLNIFKPAGSGFKHFQHFELPQHFIILSSLNISGF